MFATCRGFHPSACEYMYLDKMKWQDMYGVDLHLAKVGDMLAMSTFTMNTL